MQGERVVQCKCGKKIIYSWIWDSHDPLPVGGYEIEDREGDRIAVETCPNCGRELNNENTND